MIKRLFPALLKSVKIEGGFWGPHLETVRTQTLPHLYQYLQSTGYLDAWNLNWKEGQPNKPHIFWDSDVAKWIEAVAYSLISHPDEKLEAQVDEVVDRMAGAQSPDGYLNSYFLSVEPGQRWTNERDLHELYCAGHLIEAAVTYQQATGKRKFLEIICKYADHIDTIFGPGEGKKPGYPGHEEIELALIKLYRATGEERYLRLAKFFIDERGQQPYYFDLEARARGEDPQNFYSKFFNFHYSGYQYFQAHLPVRQQSEVVGHAVRAMYLYSGMVEIAIETGDQTLIETCQRLWKNLTEHRMYITGGIGSAGAIEGFSFDYDLPNETAYAETCAAIGLAFWAQRLLLVEPDGKYGDVMERALYNGILSGIALDGRHFFYPNPLAFYSEASLGGLSDPRGKRQSWFSCACCPTNITRFLAGLGQFIYSSSQDEVYVHLYVQSEVSLRLAGEQVSLRQETSYPWEGQVEFTVGIALPTRFTLALRVPGWCRRAFLTVNGEKTDVSAITKSGYARITRTWNSDDRVTLAFVMPVERQAANPQVRMDCGRVALQRGPIVYCLEQTDNGANLNAIRLPGESLLEWKYEPQLLGGIGVITGQGLRLNQAGWEGSLYRSASAGSEIPVPILAVPYAFWSNRTAGEMIVWVRS